MIQNFRQRIILPKGGIGKQLISIEYEMPKLSRGPPANLVIKWEGIKYILKYGESPVKL